jgi:hypothetical protein
MTAVELSLDQDSNQNKYEDGIITPPLPHGASAAAGFLFLKNCKNEQRATSERARRVGVHGRGRSRARTRMIASTKAAVVDKQTFKMNLTMMTPRRERGRVLTETRRHDTKTERNHHCSCLCAHPSSFLALMLFSD